MRDGEQDQEVSCVSLFLPFSRVQLLVPRE
jgi:hypothetical protein